MSDYPWQLPVCDPNKPITGYNSTEFERLIEKDQRWRYVFDDITGEIIGYIRTSSGFCVMVDRNGKIVYTDEIPIEPSLISPIDFIGPSIVGGAASGAARLAARLAGGAARKTSLINLALSRMRLIAEAIRAAAKASPSKAARALADKFAKSTGRIRLNLGGTGELANYINVNPLLAQQTKAVQNLVKANAEEIGVLFTRSSVDEIISNNIVQGTVNWSQVMAGAAKILKPGGRISIAPYPAGDLAAHIGQITEALNAAGFKNVQVIAGKVVEASL